MYNGFIMKQTKTPFKHYILVCEKERDNGADCCGAAGAQLTRLLKDSIRERNLKKEIRVTCTGCQETCGQGPNVIIMPESLWYQNVQPTDIEHILKELQS